jgi:hypothetical protein
MSGTRIPGARRSSSLSRAESDGAAEVMLRAKEELGVRFPLGDHQMGLDGLWYRLMHTRYHEQPSLFLAVTPFPSPSDVIGNRQGPQIFRKL